MTALLILASVLAALWVFHSLIRVAVSAVAVAALHSAPPLWVAVAVAVALTTVAAVIAYRTLSTGLMIRSEITS